MKLLKLDIRNFAGICQYTREFGESEIISAQNGEGKSTLLDAYKFALGFNINGYEPVIKPNNVRVGTPDHPCHSEVCVTVEKDGLTYTLKRVTVQKWRVNKTTQIVEFVGNDGKFYFDSESEIGANLYREKVASLFGCSYADLEIIIDLTYFNGENSKWNWASRRKWLFEKLDIESVVKGLAEAPEFDLLRNDLLKGKDEIDIQRALNAEKTSIRKSQDDNQTLIEDKTRQIAVYKTIDFVALQKRYDTLESERDKLIASTNKANKNTILGEKNIQLTALQTKLEKARSAILATKREIANRKYELQSSLDSLTAQRNGLERKLRAYGETIMANEREILSYENAKFEGQRVCNTCGQALPEADVLSQQQDFIAYNNAKKAQLHKENQGLEAERKSVEAELTALNARIADLENKIETTNATFVDESEIAKIELEISTLNAEIANLRMSEVNEDVNARIAEIKAEMVEINIQLGKKGIIADIQTAIETLKALSLKLTAQEADRLRKQAQLTLYIEKKVELVNDSVNQYFDGITFNFFKWNGANAENAFENTCEVLFDGKSYNKLSTGEKMFADIKTTQGLMSILGVDVPLWIDELQSLTRKFDCSQQYIGLKVVGGKTIDGMLRVDKMYSLADCVARG